MQSAPLILLLTDFGLQDSYVAQMKGVMHEINPNAKVVDITHDIIPQNIRQAAFVLHTCYEYFPEGSIFVLVVDPGVGSQRKPVLVNARSKFFITPDNGLLSFTLDNNESYDAVIIENDQYMNKNVSNTFHGRDVFAPAAAHLSAGNEMNDFGTKIDCKNLKRIPEMQFEKLSGQRYCAEIMHIDHYGNAITSIHKDQYSAKKRISIQIKNLLIETISKTFSDKRPKEILAYTGSSNYLEIAVREGNFAEMYNISPGEKIIINF